MTPLSEKMSRFRGYRNVSTTPRAGGLRIGTIGPTTPPKGPQAVRLCGGGLVFGEDEVVLAGCCGPTWS